MRAKQRVEDAQSKQEARYLAKKGSGVSAQFFSGDAILDNSSIDELGYFGSKAGDEYSSSMQNSAVKIPCVTAKF